MRRPTAFPVVLLLTCLGLTACRSAPRGIPDGARFIVTAAPLVLIDSRHPGLCIAVDPTNPAGVWWWEPGRSGCSSRSTGPDVFLAGDASVIARPDAGALDVHFRIPLIVGPGSQRPAFEDVRLVLRDRRMEVVGSSVSVATVRKHDIASLPESSPRR